ncbi:Protein sym1 [Vanrija pseudolonga]|uniref:Protein sym1 n=1 Tax=Vanrija pseudolonga TaxID=143232 RepID=A0AAF1BLE4_9TREE|nr:Protein sym1 [Vanrija pseudolonga]
MPVPAAASRLTAVYNRHFDTHPLLTLTATNGLLSSISDLVAQGLGMALAEKDDRPAYDPARTARFAVFGLGMGPVVGQWLRFLEFSVPMRAGHAVQVTVKRVLLDQFVFAPVGLTLFVGSMGIMEGKSRAHIKQKFDDVYWTALKANWKVWPAIQAANLGIVPLRYRLPFQQTCGILWNTYLSLLNAKQTQGKDVAHVPAVAGS